MRRANTNAAPATMPASADTAAASAPRSRKYEETSAFFLRSAPEPTMDMGIVAQEAAAEDAYAPPPPVADDDECQEPALRYLARCQRVSGAWGNESPIATVLAVQAFLHAGHTEHSGDFRPQLRRAIAWLKASANEDVVPTVIAWGLATLANTTGDATYSTERDKAIASATTALDELDVLCLTLARDAAPSAGVSVPALPAQQDERWALAVALLHQISGQIPDEVRSMLVQSQMLGGSVDGGVALPGHSVEQPDNTTIAATAVLALLC